MSKLTRYTLDEIKRRGREFMERVSRETTKQETSEITDCWEDEGKDIYQQDQAMMMSNIYHGGTTLAPQTPFPLHSGNGGSKNVGIYRSATVTIDDGFPFPTTELKTWQVEKVIDVTEIGSLERKFIKGPGTGYLEFLTTWGKAWATVISGKEVLVRIAVGPATVFLFQGRLIEYKFDQLRSTEMFMRAKLVGQYL